MFTIGSHQLETDGTETLDDFGRFMQTYDTTDILTNSRIWTGERRTRWRLTLFSTVNVPQPNNFVFTLIVFVSFLRI